MMAFGVRGRRIEKVPALFVSVLADEGLLPLAPVPPAHGVGYRTPTLEDLRRLQWLLAYDGFAADASGNRRPALGVLGFEDRYDFHTASDVRDVCYVAGSKRAIVDLLCTVAHDAEAENRRARGIFDLENMGLRRLVAKLGFPELRVIVEAR